MTKRTDSDVPGARSSAGLSSAEELSALRAELERARQQLAHETETARLFRVRHEKLLVDMREANQQLVLATTRADELASETIAARVAAVSADLASQAKDEFFAMLGHELRNPLAPIVTLLQVLRLRGETALAKERAVIERHTDHLVRLVEDLLDIARITGGKVVLKKHRIELREVIARSLEMTASLMEQQKHQLRIEVAEHGLAIEADPHRLAQVLSNLLINSAKYTEPGGLIVVSAERSGGVVRLSVRDNGIGIEPEIARTIFDRFVQAPQALDRADGGLGLGLAIVERLVELHGGKVSVFSAGKGKGSEFTVELPAAAEPKAAVLPVQVPARAKDGVRRQVLVVDDNHDAAEMLAAMLELLGHEIRVAHDGPTALKLAEAQAPEVALLDLGLPGMDGFELARQLRKQPAMRGVRLIALTGYGQERHRKLTTEAGFDGHLVKPVDVEQLEQAVNAP